MSLHTHTYIHIRTYTWARTHTHIHARTYWGILSFFSDAVFPLLHMRHDTAPAADRYTPGYCRNLPLSSFVECDGTHIVHNNRWHANPTCQDAACRRYRCTFIQCGHCRSESGAILSRRCCVICNTGPSVSANKKSSNLRHCCIAVQCCG